MQFLHLRANLLFTEKETKEEQLGETEANNKHYTHHTYKQVECNVVDVCCLAIIPDTYRLSCERRRHRTSVSCSSGP